jgi:tetratricopeptide (TPR) repeat protein
MNAWITFIIFFSVFVLSSCKKTNDQLFDEAYALTKKSEYKKAIKVYTSLLERNDKLQLAYYNRGYCYYSMKEYNKALEDFDRTIGLQTLGGGSIIFTLNSESPFASEEAKYQVPYYDALYQRAQVYFFLGKNKESFNDFGVLIANEYEEKSNCYLWQGSIIINSGDTTKACSYFSNAKQFANSKTLETEAEEMLVSFCK